MSNQSVILKDSWETSHAAVSQWNGWKDVSMDGTDIGGNIWKGVNGGKKERSQNVCLCPPPTPPALPLGTSEKVHWPFQTKYIVYIYVCMY